MIKLSTIFGNKRNQRGFLAAPILFGMVASFAAITLAGSYIGIFDKLIEQQKTVQAKNKIQQLATIIADSNLDQNGVMKVAPAMSTTAGGAAMEDGQLPDAEFGGKLPTGFSAQSRFGDVAYFSFIHMPRSTDVAPAGYFLSGAGGIPRPDEMSFALVMSGKDGVLDTKKTDVANGIARGDDIAVFKTVRDVNPGAYKNLIESAGNIPTCGVADPAAEIRTHTTLKWNIDDKKWECVDSGIPSFLIRSTDAAQNVPTCPANTALTLQLLHEGTPQERQVLTCISTIAPRPRSDFGLIYDENGNIASLIDSDMAASAPCAGGDTTVFRWTGTQISCAGNTHGVGTTSCPAGSWLALPLSRMTSCYPFNAESLLRNGGAGARQTCNGGITPYFANGHTFCPEDANPGGVRVCKYGFDTAFIGNMGGFGCYILNDPMQAGGSAEDIAVHYQAPCTAGYVLQVQANDRTYVKCVSIFDALSFAMPAAACPQINGKRGALTYTTVGTKRFTCTAVD